MKKKLINICSLVLLSLFIFSSFTAIALEKDIIINKEDFRLTNYKNNAVVGEYYVLNISFSKDFLIGKSDISYKLVGDNENISVFNRCVDVSYSIVGKQISFTGKVKQWGVYSIDIVPVISGISVFQYAWWNSSWGYSTGSCISNNVTNYAMMLNISFNDDNSYVNMNGHCQANFSDIRFINSGNNSELYHWCEYKENSKFAYFWVNISTNDYINIYYGSTVGVGNSTYNSGNNTFYLFEDFNSISDWTNYAGGGFSVSSGIMMAVSSGSYRYMYKTITGNNYFIKSKMFYNTWSSSSYGINSISLESTFETVTWTNIANNEIWLTLLPGNMLRNEVKNNAGVYINCIFFSLSTDWWKVAYAEFNGYQSVMDINNYVNSQTNNYELTTYPTKIGFKLRPVATFTTKYDWLFVGIHSVVEPVFCNWYLEVSYCEYNNFLTNVSPNDNSIVSGINISYITVESHFLDGLADSINLSINADNGLFYINDTTNVVNGTYSLNVMLANFTSENYYTYYVNITNDLCVVSYNYTFQTVYMGGYPEFQILSYKMNMLYEYMLKGDENMQIIFDISQFFLIILLTLWIFFITKFYETRRTLFSIIQFGLCIPLTLAIALISLSYAFGYIIIFIIPSISIYIVIEGHFYNKKQKKLK